MVEAIRPDIDTTPLARRIDWMRKTGADYIVIARKLRIAPVFAKRVHVEWTNNNLRMDQ